jgi:hypothetical protein
MNLSLLKNNYFQFGNKRQTLVTAIEYAMFLQCKPSENNQSTTMFIEFTMETDYNSILIQNKLTHHAIYDTSKTTL